MFSGFVLTVYGAMGLFNVGVPGVEELVLFATTTEGSYIYAVAFVAMFIEGLYIIGAVFPGATLVLIIAVLSQTGGMLMFALTIISIFLGWCVAGAVNVCVARFYRHHVSIPEYDTTISIKPWTTWFPTLRANYEVAQVIEGINPKKVFLSSLPLRFTTCLVAASVGLLIPYIVDLHEISNEEGFVSVAILATICYLVGGAKIRTYILRTQSPNE